jgi:hypothetical protein
MIVRQLLFPLGWSNPHILAPQRASHNAAADAEDILRAIAGMVVLKEYRSDEPVYLALGILTTPSNSARRHIIRSTMLQSSKAVRRGHVVFRFVVGCSSGAGCESAMNMLKDDMLVLDALDGSAVSDHGPNCACLEKTTEWFKYAVQRWPQARFYGKTEEDTYIHIDAMLFELTRLGARHNLAFGKWSTCAMPDLPVKEVEHVPPPRGQDYRKWGRKQSKTNSIGFQVRVETPHL